MSFGSFAMAAHTWTASNLPFMQTLLSDYAKKGFLCALTHNGATTLLSRARLVLLHDCKYLCHCTLPPGQSPPLYHEECCYLPLRSWKHNQVSIQIGCRVPVSTSYCFVCGLPHHHVYECLCALAMRNCWNCVGVDQTPGCCNMFLSHLCRDRKLKRRMVTAAGCNLFSHRQQVQRFLK